MVITDRLSESKQLDEIFKEDHEVVFYSTKEEALEKINYYLNNPIEREKIAENGFNKVMNSFTTNNIVEYVLSGKDD
jgi:spore maturation protein CgeB